MTTFFNQDDLGESPQKSGTASGQQPSGPAALFGGSAPSPDGAKTPSSRKSLADFERAYALLEAELRRQVTRLTKSNARLRREVDGRRRVEARLKANSRELALSLQELEEQRSLAQLIVENIAEGVVVADSSGRFVMFNPAAKEIVGLGNAAIDPTDWIGHYGLFLPDQQTPYPQEEIALARALRGEHVDNQEVFVRHASRPEGVWVSVNARPIRNARNAVSGGIVVFRDVTDRKRWEAELLDASRELQTLFEALPDKYIRIDLNGTILSYQAHKNTQWYVPPAEFLGKRAQDILPPDVAAGVDRVLQELRAGSDSASLDYHLDYPDRRRAFEGRFVRFGVDQAILIVRDVTDIKDYQADLEAAKNRAEAASRAKSEFLANISHEVRTPMNGVTGMLELLLRTPLSETQREYVTVAQASSDVLLNIINDLLDLATIESGKLRLERRLLDLRNTIHQTAELLRPKASARNLSLAVRYPDDAPTAFFGDSMRIQQIVLNLIENAIKFTRQGGIEISVDIEAISAPADDSLSRVRLRVSDTGIGIPADRLKDIFEKFVQVDASTTRRYGGTGLGLAICRQLAELMGGSISVESTVGSGSVFTVDFFLALQVCPSRGSRS